MTNTTQADTAHLDSLFGMQTHRHLIMVLILVLLGIIILLYSNRALDDIPAKIDLSTINSNSRDASTTKPTDSVAWLLQIKGAIGPATSDYVTRNIDAATSNVEMVILTMDTPGGLDSSMREIIRSILDSQVPVVGFVSPQGARAASAGTYILYASHIAAMSPATSLGAATPVQIGGGFDMPKPKQPEGDESDPNQSPIDNVDAIKMKSINDAAAYIRGLAELRGRNIEWAEQAVRQASSLPSQEALEMNVIDLIAADIDELMQKIDGREITIQGQSTVLDTASLQIEAINPDWRNRFLSVITDPNVAYILLLIGVYGLFLEFYNPGTIIPGVAGAISLLVALYAFQVLPINYVGLALIMLGILLMIMEAFIPSTGILAIGGVVSFVLGSVILMDTESESFKIALPLILALASFCAISLVLIIGMVLRARRSPLVSGDDAMIGEDAEILEDFYDQGLVRVNGELWQAKTDKPVYRGQIVPVKAIKGMQLRLTNRDEQTGDQS